MAESLPASLQAALADLAEWLEISSVPWTVIGGVAASTLGRPRLTQDIDALVVVPEARWGAIIESAGRHGIVPRVADALDFARRSRVLLLRHVRSGIDVDITFGGLSFEEEIVAKSELHDIGALRVRLPRVEDLLVMKAIARRPKDIEDIRGLLAAHPQVDVAEARRLIGEFALAMSMSDMLEEFDKLVAQRNSGA